jgi:predicted ATP-dependent endonuclease of OLD family
MKIEELEIENYKCINNKGMPLKFSDLNIFIGENDSGKTSLLEVVEIIYKQKEVKKSMFFDTKEDLLVTTNFTQIAKSIINEATQLQRLDLCFDDYIKAANIGSDPYLAYENVFKNNAFMTFKDLLELLKEYSFFKDLRIFLVTC